MSQSDPPGKPEQSKHASTAEKGSPANSSRREFIVASASIAGAAAMLSPLLASVQSDDTAGATVTSAGFPSARISLTVNGRARDLDIDSRQSLLDVLRETLGMTGTKKGCNQGACGACTVMVNGRRIVSCLAPAVLYGGADVTTIEGLAQRDELHPLQAAFIEHEGFQCGFCTSGQVMSGVACIQEGHAGSETEVRYWMSGNICRCGAYKGITAAIAAVARRESS